MRHKRGKQVTENADVVEKGETADKLSKIQIEQMRYRQYTKMKQVKKDPDVVDDLNITDVDEADKV